jgi:hypothetical protein
VTRTWKRGIGFFDSRHTHAVLREDPSEIDMVGSTSCARARERSRTTSSTSSWPDISRRDFLRRGASSECRSRCSARSCPRAGARAPRRRPRATSAARSGAGATIKAGIIVPTAAINPLTVADQGGLDMLAQTGEYLCLSDQQLTLQPVLARAGAPTRLADVWTFKIRQGVKFHDGTPLTADDVVYTYKLQTDPKNGVERPLRLRRGARPGRRQEGRRLHRGLPPRGPERELPVPAPRTTTT